MKKKAIITGINGQDGYFLSRFLLKKNYDIYGFYRNLNNGWIKENDRNNLNLLHCDIKDEKKVNEYIINIKPDEIYNLASQSRPSSSWKEEQETFQVNLFGTVNIFRSVLENNFKSKIFHASSSEMFGATKESSINNNCLMEAVNPYGVSKIAAHNYCKIFRETYNLFISTGIMFNHESEFRPKDFLSQKIAYGAACAKLNILNSPDFNELGLPMVNNGKLELGNLDVMKDWGYAGDYVKCMWLMLQETSPDDYVVGTGKLHSIKEMCVAAYSSVGLNWENHIKINSNLKRISETNTISANTTKAYNNLKWKAETTFKEMIKNMVYKQIIKLKK